MTFSFGGFDSFLGEVRIGVKTGGGGGGGGR